jgi:hypothetical protein
MIRLLTWLAVAVLAISACATAKAAPQSVPTGTFNGCPRHVLPLPGSATSYTPAVRKVVLRFVTTTFARRSKTPKQLIGARTTGVQLVRHWLPSGWIKSECGKAVWDRSIAVFVYFPAMDLPHNPIGHCNDCDHITFITSRTPTDWTVWGLY